MISAFGVEHSGISKMSDNELRHRKRVQAGLSTAGAVVGLSALGAKGVKVGTGKYLKPAAKAAKINTKIDSGVNNALVAGGGIGGAAGLNSASISRKEAGKKHHVKKSVDIGTQANQHKAKHKITVTVPKLGPKGRRHVALATGTGTLAGAGLAAGESKKKLAIGLISAGSALSAYAASEPGEKRMSKSAFGVEHDAVSKGYTERRKHLSPTGQKAYIRSKDAAYIGIGSGTVAHMAGTSLHNSGQEGNLRALGETLGEYEGSKNISRITRNARKINAGMKLKRAGNAAAVAGLGAAGAATAINSRANHKNKMSKAFDPESRRHTQLGTAAGVAGTVSVASGVGAARSAKKARGHYRAASGANQATKTRLLEGLNLKGAAQVQHAQKTAVNHGEMLRHIKAGNTAAHRARGKTGVALGTAAAAGALVHHSNNGAANYVGPYQPKAKYAQGAKRTVGRIKSKLS